MYQITVNYVNKDNPFTFHAEEVFGVTAGVEGIVDFSVLSFGYIDSNDRPVIEYLVPTSNVLWIHTEYSESIPEEEVH